VLYETRKELLIKAFGATLQDRDLFVSSYVSLIWGNRGVGKEPVMKKLIYSCAFALGLAMGLSACTDPYDPGQRAIGGLFGAATTPSSSYYGYGSSGPGYYSRTYYGSGFYGSGYNGPGYNGSGYYGYGY
jgi:hypothetical protein